MDNDLEQNPEDLSLLYQKAQEGYDLVYGVYEARTHSRWRNLTSEIARKMFRVAIPSLNDAYTSFRLIRRPVAHALERFDSPYPFVDGYLSWLTNRYATVTVKHGTRNEGRSTYTFRKLFAHTLNIFVTFSDLPLKMATWIGIGSAGLGAIAFLAILLNKLLGGITVSGYASLMAAILLFGGIQLFILGVMGEYLGRINFKTSRKPLYLVARETPTLAETEQENA
jgi:undecaprenyl-phosphate 4-deoxy-4-formamido-L-arabinose transferase